MAEKEEALQGANQKSTDVELQLMEAHEQIAALKQEHFDVKFKLKGIIAGRKIQIINQSFTPNFKSIAIETCSMTQLKLKFLANQHIPGKIKAEIFSSSLSSGNLFH